MRYYINFKIYILINVLKWYGIFNKFDIKIIYIYIYSFYVSFDFVLFSFTIF